MENIPIRFFMSVYLHVFLSSIFIFIHRNMSWSPSTDLRRAVVSYWRKYVHEVPVNRLGGLNLPRTSVVSLTDLPDMTIAVYRGRKTTTQQQQRQ